MKKAGVRFLLLVSVFLVPYTCQGCSFPVELTGTWYSSAKGAVTIATSTSTTIPSYKTDKFGNVDLTCHLNSGNKYVFKSATFSYLGLDFETYVCFVLTTRISARKYIYHLGSVENPDALDERLKTELITSGASPTVASICDRTTYDAGTEHIFLKNDGNELSSVIDCPFSIRSRHYDYTFKTTGSLNTYCASDSELNVCNQPSANTFTFNYTACPTIQAYSATGVLKCMYYSSDSQFTYLQVYNTDTTTDESTTYRFTCYVLQRSGTTMYGTQYPARCLSSQNSTYVPTPGATLTFTRILDCPYDSSSTVISTASAVGATLGVLFLIVIILCLCMIWYYYKKRKEREAIDKLPLQKQHPANVRLANGDLYRNGKSRDSKKSAAVNGDCKVNIDFDPAVRRENSIHISMASRGGSGMGGFEPMEPTKRVGPAPVEEPEQAKVSSKPEPTIIENETEAALASTFLPMTPDQRTELVFTDEEIRAIERKDAEEKRKKEEEKEEEDDDDDEFNMDDIDDELGLPRLSRAFTPVMQPEEPTLPSLAFKKKPGDDTDSDVDKRADGIKKVKVKKNMKKKRRVVSSKGSRQRPKSSLKPKAESFRETPFLERIKKLDSEKADLETREKIEKEMKQIENEVIKARLAKDAQTSRAAPSSKYVVDGAGTKLFQSADKGPVSATSATGERRRFGDPPSDNTRKNRKRTPRLRHPMEIQADNEELQEQGDLKKAEGFWKEEKKVRSGRRRDHPEAVTIPSVKEDPFDHREHRHADSSAFSQARSGKSAAGMRPDRENSAFIEPAKGTATNDEVWDKASSLWHFKNQPIWGNLNHH